MEQYGFFLGPDKVGSSWLHRLLKWHPEVATPAAKELFFFDRYFDRGMDWYLRQFPISDRTQIAVEVCHEYLFSVPARDRIHSVWPDAALVVGLRHPIDRARSSYLYMRRQGRVSGSFNSAVRSVAELVDHSRYGQWISIYLERFGPAQLHVFDFEDLRDDPVSVARGVLAHFGVASEGVPEELLGVVRPAAQARNQTVARLGKEAANSLRRWRLEHVLGRLKASSTLDRLLFRPLSEDLKPKVNEETRAWLQARLERDSIALDELLGTNYRTTWWGLS